MSNFAHERDLFLRERQLHRYASKFCIPLPWAFRWPYLKASVPLKLTDKLCRLMPICEAIRFRTALAPVPLSFLGVALRRSCEQQHSAVHKTDASQCEGTRAKNFSRLAPSTSCAGCVFEVCHDVLWRCVGFAYCTDSVPLGPLVGCNAVPNTGLNKSSVYSTPTPGTNSKQHLWGRRRRSITSKQLPTTMYREE